LKESYEKETFVIILWICFVEDRFMNVDCDLLLEKIRVNKEVSVLYAGEKERLCLA